MDKTAQLSILKPENLAGALAVEHLKGAYPKWSEGDNPVVLVRLDSECNPSFVLENNKLTAQDYILVDTITNGAKNCVEQEIFNSLERLLPTFEAVVLPEYACPTVLDGLPQSFLDKCDNTVAFVKNISAVPSDLKTSSVPVLRISRFDAQRVIDCYVTSEQLEVSVTGQSCPIDTKISLQAKYRVPSNKKDGDSSTSLPTLQLWRVPMHLTKGTDIFRTESFVRMLGKLDQYIHIEPKVALLKGSEIGCNADQLASYCSSICDSTAQFCLRGHGDAVNGTQLVEEAMRLSCIWDTSDEEQATRFEHLASYASGMATQCGSSVTEECSSEVQAFVGINPKTTGDCVSSKGLALLEAQHASQGGLLPSPSFMVNNVLITPDDRGVVTGKVATVLCEFSFDSSSSSYPRDLCDCVRRNAIDEEALTRECWGETNNGISTEIIILIVSLLVTLGALIIVTHKYRRLLLLRTSLNPHTKPGIQLTTFSDKSSSV